MRRVHVGSLFLLTLVVGCALLGANIILGDLNQDEGWYLYAARMVRGGEMPYRDFAYTQAPVLPFVYALVEPLVGKYALLAAALAATLAPREARRESALLALVLILVNVYQAYFNAVVKTYALTAFFLLAGFLVLSAAFQGRARRAWLPAKPALFLSAVLFVLAAGTRSSAGIVLPIVFVFLCLDGGSRASFGWLWFGLGGFLAGCALALPFLAAAPESFWFCAVSYPTLRESGGFWSGMVYKAGFVSRLLQAYFVPIGLFSAIAAAGLVRRATSCRSGAGGEAAQAAAVPPPDGPGAGSGGLPVGLNAVLWACIIGATLVHLLAPFPYDDYQAFVFPLFATGAAVMAVGFARRAGVRTDWLVLTVFLLCLMASVSSPINQDWFMQGRDRIWWRLKAQTPLSKLRDAASLIRGMAEPGSVLLTQDPYLAVESGMSLPRGMEMGQFCYFPGFDDETAAKRHVLNRDGMIRALRECDAPVAALSGYAFAIRSPQVEPVSAEDQSLFWGEISRRYEPVQEIRDFGQAFTTLVILRKHSK